MPALSAGENVQPTTRLYDGQLYYFQSLQKGEDDHLRSEYFQIDQHLEETLFTEDNADGLLQKAERKLELGKVLDNQVLFRDIMDCLILAKYYFDFCRDSEMKLKLTDKINLLQKEANLAVKPYPEHLKIEVNILTPLINSCNTIQCLF